jgi:predicted MFS family arabinose efflux permease
MFAVAAFSSAPQTRAATDGACWDEDAGRPEWDEPPQPPATATHSADASVDHQSRRRRTPISSVQPPLIASRAYSGRIGADPPMVLRMQRLSLARNRDFMVLWTGATVSEVGSQISTVAYPLLILALSGSAAQAGVVGLAKWLPLALFALPAGVVADRIDRKRAMIVCDGIRALALLSIPVALWTGRPPYLQIVGIAFLDSTLFVTSHICERGAIRHVVPAEQLPEAVAQTQVRQFGAIIAGPPLGGLLFAASRFLPFLADAVTFAASMIGLSLTRSSFQDERAQRQKRRKAWREPVEGFRWLWQRPFFRTAVLLFAAGNPYFTGLYLLAILLAKHHGASSGAIGAMFAIAGAGGLLGAVGAGRLRRRMPIRTALVAGNWVLVGAAPLLLVAHSAVVIGLIVGVAELLTPLVNSIVSGARVAATPDELQGRVQAAGTSLAMSLGWLGPLAIGVVFGAAGPTATVLLMLGWALGLALATTLARSLRDGPQVPASAVARQAAGA